MAKRIKIKKIFTILLAVILGIGVITAGVFILKPKETKRIHPTFHVGNIDNNGKYVESDDSIYSDMFECQGLKIEPNFSTNVKFNVYYYQFDETFIKADTEQSDKYEAPKDETYRYARVVIFPDKDGKTAEKFKIRFWNVGSIANDIKIFVNTDQGEVKNLAEVSENGKWSDINNQPTPSWKKLEPIDIKGINKLAFVFDAGLDTISDLVEVYYGSIDASGKVTLDSKLDLGTISSLVHPINVSGNTIFVSVHEDVSLKIYKYN